MQVVIDIDDHEYTEIKEDAEKFRSKGMVVPYLYKVIESGVSLPKGHGKLVDLDQMCDDYWDGNYMEIHSEDLKNIKTIIEADTEDKEQEEERV